jgi:hypothetical protein
MKDGFDKATSKAAVTDLWSKTREDRRELLSAEQISALEVDKAAALGRFAARA